MAMTDFKKPHQERTSRKKEEATHSPEGVDLTLIRWMLSLTPAERLQTLQDNVQSLLRLRGQDVET